MEVWKDILSCKRQELGAIGALQRKGYFTDEEGRIIGDYSRSQSIVAEYAILANTLVADWGRKQNLPLVYRNHQPIATDTNDLRIHMNNLSITREERSQYYHLLGKAKYSIHNKGHFALALPGYLHFTSPLRRFADFVNHRMLKARLRGTQVPYDRKTLENIAEKINRRIELEDSQRKEHFKQKFYEEVSQATDYNALNDKELFNIIKKGNYNEKLLSETLQLRILNQTLENRTTVAALFLSESKSIQKVLIESIPEDEIIQIVNLADALIEKLQVEFFERENTQQLNKLDPCNQWWCELKLILNEIEVKVTGRGSTKKAAKLDVAKRCLWKWSGEIVPEQVEELESAHIEDFSQVSCEIVEQTTDYNALNDKELFNIIKEGNYNEKLLSETLQLRISNQTLESKSTIAGLFLTESKSIHKALIETIPEDEIIQIVNLADALIEKLQVEFFEQENTQQLNKLDPCNQWWSELKLIVDEVEVKATGRGSTKKAALIRCRKKVLMEMEWSQAS